MSNLKILIKGFLSNFYYKENNHIILNIFGFKFGIFRRIRNCKIKGKNNCLTLKYNGDKHKIFNNFRIVKGLKIDIKGDNNIIILRSIKFKNSVIKIESSNNIIEIGEKCRLINLQAFIINGDNQSLNIGNNVTSEYVDIFLIEKNSSISIGNDCMFSSMITIYSADGHTVLDKLTNKILNRPLGVIIGNHVWISYGVHICKNAGIPNNLIVGARSVVTKRFNEENIVIAGSPAKIIKTGIKWDRLTIAKKEKELNYI